MREPADAAQVVIVGGGPVGMGLAIELGRRGIAAMVVERYLKPQPIPKGQTLTQRTMEHFHFWAWSRPYARLAPSRGNTAHGNEHGRDVTADKILHRRGRPAIGHMLHLSACSKPEEFHGEMLRCTAARGGVVHLAGVGLEKGHELLRRGGGNRGMDR